VIIPDTIETPLEGGPTTKELIEQAGGTAFHLQTDIADWNAVDRMLQATIGAAAIFHVEQLVLVPNRTLGDQASPLTNLDVRSVGRCSKGASK
jgi:hypothetical protein